MLRRVLGPYGATSPENLPFGVFVTLVVERVREFQHLDYKRELPTDTEEFAHDVVAMANGGGGLLVFGIADNKHDEAVEIMNVPLAGSAARLRDIAISRVRPYLSYQILDVSNPEDSDQGVVVFVVPQSDMKPFAAEDKGRFRYKIRSGREKRDMTEADIERMYRERFRFTEQFDARLADLSNRASDLPGSVTSNPRAYIAGLPFEQAQERAFTVNSDTTAEVRSLAAKSLIGSGTGLDVRPDFRHYRITRDGRPNSIRTELHDDGGFLGTIAGELRKDDDGATRARFWEERLIADVLDRLIVFGSFSETFNVHGDVAIQAGLAEFIRPVFLIRDPHSDIGLGITSPISTRIHADASQLQPGPALVAVAKRLLDDLFTAFGYEGCRMLTSQGEIDGGWMTFPPLRRWAEQHGIPII